MGLDCCNQVHLALTVRLPSCHYIRFPLQFSFCPLPKVILLLDTTEPRTKGRTIPVRYIVLGPGYKKNVVPGKRVTRLPDWTTPLAFPTFPYRTWQNVYTKMSQDVGSAKRVMPLAESSFCDGRVMILLAGATFLHKNTLVQPRQDWLSR